MVKKKRLLCWVFLICSSIFILLSFPHCSLQWEAGKYHIPCCFGFGWVEVLVGVGEGRQEMYRLSRLCPSTKGHSCIKFSSIYILSLYYASVCVFLCVCITFFYSFTHQQALRTGCSEHGGVYIFLSSCFHYVILRKFWKAKFLQCSPI